jgi:hypothetical protein
MTDTEFDDVIEKIVYWLEASRLRFGAAVFGFLVMCISVLHFLIVWVHWDTADTYNGMRWGIFIPYILIALAVWAFPILNALLLLVRTQTKPLIARWKTSATKSAIDAHQRRRLAESKSEKMERDLEAAQRELDMILNS